MYSSSSCSSNSDDDENNLVINNNNRGNPIELDSNLAIAWVGLKFYGRRNLKTVTLLNDINGSIELGTITALMGPSGAGKSTLLKCINGRQISGIDGITDIYLHSEIKIRSCFIVQDVKEHLLSGLTALQSLVYASKLKNHTIVCDHKQNALDLLAELSISHISRTSVEKCSGGEQKRLAIALELTSVGKPNLLCIDEPTSGLDSYAAEEVIQCLKHVTEMHRIAVVTSIHQPNNEIIMKFDKLYVLGKGGICIYEGPPRGLTSHLSAVNIHLNHDQVPIEVLIKISSRSNDRNNLKAEQMARIMSGKRHALEEMCIEQAHLSNGISQQKVRFNISCHMLYLMMRSVVYTFRHRLFAILFQFSLIVGLAFLLTSMFNKNIGEPSGCVPPGMTKSCNESNSTLEAEKDLSENQRLHFFALLAIQFLITVPTVLVFTNEVRLFFNEHKNGWYSTGSYYWAKTLVELPLCLAVTISYAYIVYTSNGQLDEEFRLLSYIGVMSLGALTAQGLGFTIGIIANSDEKLANIMSVGVYLFNLLLCGFFAPVDELPNYISWITYLSFAKQCFEMQMYIIYGFDRCPTGQSSTVLNNMKIAEKDKYITNRNMLIAHAVVIRVIPLVILLVKANQYKVDEGIRKIKRLKKYFVKGRAGYTPL